MQRLGSARTTGQRFLTATRKVVPKHVYVYSGYNAPTLFQNL